MAGGFRTFRDSLLTLTNTGNLLRDDSLRYPGVPSQVQVYATGSVFGLTAVVRFGNETVFDGAINVEAAANRGPIVPHDQIAEDAISSFDQLDIVITNPTAGTIVSIVKVAVVPVA